MYIRWKELARKTIARHVFSPNRPEDRIPDTLYVAYLVESKRIDSKPRQKTLYLASIRATRLGDAYWRRRFWQIVAAKITPLHLPIEQERALKATLNERVPAV